MRHRRVFTFLLPVALFVTGNFLQDTQVQAAEITLTSGSVVFDCNQQVFGLSSIDLTGQDFSLHFSFSPRPFPQCEPAQINLFPSRYDAFALATFQGVTTFEMTGALSFNESSLTGVVEGRDLFNPDVVLFTVNFSGSGVGVITSMRSTFTVVPEPTTLVLLGTGMATFLAARRKRRNRVIRP